MTPRRKPPERSTGKRPPLKSTKVGERTLIFYDSILSVLGVDPATEPPGRPVTVTIKRAKELTGLSERTVNRMIVEGREPAEMK